MKIKVKVHGHDYFAEHVGEPIAWLQCAETYHDQDSALVQVPCVLLRTAAAVLMIPLQTERRWTEIEILSSRGETMQYETYRRFPRSLREAFREWPENALGINDPGCIPTRSPWWVRVLRWLGGAR